MKGRHLDKQMPHANVGTRREPSWRKTSRVLDRRDAERVPLRTYVSYVTDERMGLSRGQGWLVDLSKTGCKITGPVLMLGTSVTIVLYFADEQDPLCVCGATVTWSDGDSFGVRFPKLNGADRQRLQELVLKFATLRGKSQQHTAFRLA
ncbi:MAG TPA: PilZ domain-containing protein [Nitrospira sp.]|jgi:PilZ domain|nr:PilZ domain-containing protein [Nitrospira sp.]